MDDTKPPVDQTGPPAFNDEATMDGSRVVMPPVGSPDVFYLLVFHEASSRMIELPLQGEVFVGRGSNVQVALEDASVSRLHAKLLIADGEAMIEDLNSRNGTFVNGERLVSARALVSGDTISVCSVTMVYNATARPRGTRVAVDMQRLRQRGEEEIERSLKYQRPLTILALTLGVEASDREALSRSILRELSLMDVVAWGGPKELVLLMPETGATEAPSAAAGLLRAVGTAASEPRLGFATCPEDGCDFETLLSSARAAAQSAAAGKVAGASNAFRTLQVGKRTIVVADPAMVRLYALVERLAASDIAVLIHGETGAGKEMVATALHYWSARASRPLVTLNCAALQETLLESELFGHEKGAFSGAVASKQGLLESASGGTVLLDEIGELSPTAQAKLLRALETKRVIRLGDVREREIDIRIAAATNRNLQDDVRANRFRQDLYYRLSGATVWLPPLRSRKREMPILAQAFLREACDTNGREQMTISARAMQLLATHGWPGNVRELKNVMEYLAATVDEQAVQPWHLERLGGPSLAPGGPPPEEAAAAAGEADAGAATGEGASFRPIEEELREFERNRMVEALRVTGGNQTRAAKLIRMPLRTFAAKLKQYDIPREGKRGT
jgi:two-component system, NtrC family, response regulator AtoC